MIEDNAHGLFGEYRGRPLGSFGGLAAQSFHETKNISCGEGGALVINDARYAERAEIIREKGTNRSRMFRGLVDKYTWVDVGSSALPSDILAAFLYAQLERRADIQAKRRRIWERYARELPGWAGGPAASASRSSPSTASSRTTSSTWSPRSLDAAHAADRASQGARDPGGLPLPAAAPLRDGPALRRASPATAR